jgi:hypothetical protein
MKWTRLSKLQSCLLGCEIETISAGFTINFFYKLQFISLVQLMYEEKLFLSLHSLLRGLELNFLIRLCATDVASASVFLFFSHLLSFFKPRRKY